MLKVLKPASIYFEITRKLKFGSNSHIFVTVINHDKMAFFNPPQFFVRSYPLVNDRVREALGDTFYEEFMVRIQIDWSQFDERFLLRHFKRARLRYDKSYGNHNALYD